MIEIKTLSEFTQEYLHSLGHNGYVSNSVYEISKNENNNEISFTLKPVILKTSFIKTYPLSNELFEKYAKIISEGFSFGAYDNGRIAGAVIAEQWLWNNSLNIELIIVAEEYRCKGIGTLLLKHLEEKTKIHKPRMIGLETQNTNTAAINFYRKNGFEITGLSLFLYNDEMNKNEAAIYMAKQLT